MEKSLRALAACVCLLVLAPLSLRAQPPVRESAAFEQYLKKPKGEFAKLVCLLNYYRTGDFTVRFDGFDYTPSFAFPHAKAWLSRTTTRKMPRNGCGSTVTFRRSRGRSFTSSFPAAIMKWPAT